MKVLRCEFRNIKLYNEDLVIDFIASDRVGEKEEVYKQSDILNLQKVITIIGNNATGKTVCLRLIDLAFKLLEDNTALINEKIDFSLLKEDSEIIIDFILDNQIYRLKSIIGIKETNIDLFTTENKFYFKNEFIYKKDISSVKKEEDIFNWTDNQLLFERSKLDQNLKSYLSSNHSMIIKITKDTFFRYIPHIDQSNINTLAEGLRYDKSFINLFDNSLEKVEYKRNQKIKIKYKNENINYSLSDINDQFKLISSSTIKGTTILALIAALFNAGGGYLIIDEMEAHLNKTLVEFIIGLFMDENINKNGSVLIFTTQYLEIVDLNKRKDAIYVASKEANYNLKLEKLSDIINHSDAKENEVLLSKYLKNTSLDFEIMQKVKELIYSI
ncbi:MAG: AAA family ATPase [Sphaerochaetaceae bacterium]|nr:AAA family ATPase [Sphaerochaetaceae bacterium]